MPALAEIQSSLPLFATKVAPKPVSSRPVCKICSDTMVAAEASTLSDQCVSYLWSCDTCGYGFVTKHTIKPLASN